ncbi:MAG: hypothetical protein GWN30_21530, partial [Gammaproteobacteria bacterium]|nr:hypothetical protein [Gammaproteobacteria bacterium]
MDTKLEPTSDKQPDTIDKPNNIKFAVYWIVALAMLGIILALLFLATEPAFIL